MSGTDVLDFCATGTGLLTVCCHCGRVRTPEGRWIVREVPSDQSVSHGICRACFQEYYPDIPVPSNVR